MHPRNHFITLLLSAVTAAAAQAAPVYTVTQASVTDLGTLPGGSISEAKAVNDLGDIVGSSNDANLKTRPIIIQNGFLSAIDTAAFPFSAAQAVGINNSRQVVGWYFIEPVPFGEIDTGAFYWDPATTMFKMEWNVAPALPHQWNSLAYGINNSGRVAGHVRRVPSVNPVPNSSALCYDDLPVQWATPWPGSFPARLFCIADPDLNETWQGQGPRPSARAINNLGNIVGNDAGTSTYSMFIFKNGVRQSVPAPAGVPTVVNGQPVQGYALAVNDKNQVAGTFGYDLGDSPISGRRAFFWNGVSGQAVNLGTLTANTWSEARGINESSMVVGSSQKTWTFPVAATREVAFLWHESFGMYALPGLPTGNLLQRPGHCRANAISELIAGARLIVVGRCYLPNGLDWHAVRWDISVSAAIVLP